MTTDSETMEQYLTFVWSRFLISVLVFVFTDLELGRVAVQFANAFAIAITLARWRHGGIPKCCLHMLLQLQLHSLGGGGVRRRPSVPYGANFLILIFMS